MALIGTISGSVGVGNSLISATAISGTLIIADAAPGDFPALTSGVKLFVSGNKTTLGADTPNAIFGGDTFVSGAFGTDSYIQMKPVMALRIPTNTTASYVYTSGSTNDLYFTQYQPGTGYTNTTRLRWLESSIGTGLLHGGVLSTANGTTTFSVTEGSGIIVTQNASTTTDPYPVLTNVDWVAVVSQSLTYVATDQITYISVDSAGTINQSPNPPTITQKESNIYLGRILHQVGSVTNGSITEPAISYGLGESTFNFQRAFGPLKLSGHVLAVSQSAGLGTLGLTKTAGDSYVEGRNYTNNPNSPNLVLAADDPALTDCKIFREYTDVSGDPVIDTNGGLGHAVIDPTQYNNGGSLAAVNNNEWSNQRVYWYPRSVNRALYVYYGPQKYSTFNEAIGGLSTETFTEGANTLGSAVFVGVITVKANETTLDAADARITPGPLHRGAGFGGGGGGSTSPGGSSTYVQFNDAGVFGGDAGFTYNKTTDSVTVVGDITGSNILLTGNITGSNLRLTGDLAVLGGDLTTTAIAFNLLNDTATTVNFAGGATAATNIGNASGIITLAGVVTASGDLAVNGGDITTTFAGTFNLLNLTSSQALTVGGSAGTINIGSTSTATTNTNIQTATNSAAGTIKTINIGTQTAGAGQVYVNIGSTTARLGNARITLHNEVHLTSGTLVGSPGGVNNELTLVSSGSAVVRLDTNNDAPGHRFEIRDWNNATEFAVSETGDAEIAGNLLITGSSLSTQTTTTFNLLTTALTGTLNVSALASTINFGGSITTSSFQGEVIAGAKTLIASVSEKLTHTSSAGSIVNFDLRNNNIFYVTNPITANITANFINTPTTPDRVITPTIILSQSATPRIVNGIQVNNASGSILWANNVVPTGNANKQDVFGFSLIRSGSIWTVLGQMSSYG